MSLSLIPGRRKKPRHSADIRIAELKKAHATELAELAAKYERQLDAIRRDNSLLLNRAAAADDYFAILTCEVETSDQALKQEKERLRQEEERRQLAEIELVQAEEAIRVRDATIADLQRRVDVGVKAEHIIAQTQEIPVITPVMPLHEARDEGLLDPASIPGRVYAEGVAS